MGARVLTTQYLGRIRTYNCNDDRLRGVFCSSPQGPKKVGTFSLFPLSTPNSVACLCIWPLLPVFHCVVHPSWNCCLSSLVRDLSGSVTLFMWELQLAIYDWVPTLAARTHATIAISTRGLYSPVPPFNNLLFPTAAAVIQLEASCKASAFSFSQCLALGLPVSCNCWGCAGTAGLHHIVVLSMLELFQKLTNCNSALAVWETPNLVQLPWRIGLP